MALTPPPTAISPPLRPAAPIRVRTLAIAACAAPALGVALALVIHQQILPLPAHVVTPAAAVLLGLGLIAGALVTRQLLKRLTAQQLVDEALHAWNLGEPNPESLAITATNNGGVIAWNRLVHELTEAHQRDVQGHTAQRLGTLGPKAAEASPILDLLPFGILVIAPDATVTTANGAAGRMLRRSRERLVGAPLDRLIESDAFTQLWSDLKSRPGSRGGSAELPLNQGDDDTPAMARITVRPMGKGEHPDTLVLLEDITQQRAADRSRHLFVAQATHELRTPLTNIALYVERAIDLGNDEVADRAECLNVINDEVLRLNRLVGEVLSVSEIEAGSLSVKRDEVKIDTLVDDLRDTFERQAQKNSLTLTFDLPPKLPAVQGDRDKIALALHNLLGNAIKYTPAGGEITVRLAEANGQVEFSVTDTGIGIGPDDLPRVFDKFYRAQDERLATIEGSGLGLALAREVIRLHQGNITVESTLNQGSTFTLTLPLEALTAV